jgi:ribosomal protein L14E/L6E/L27E
MFDLLVELLEKCLFGCNVKFFTSQRIQLIFNMNSILTLQLFTMKKTLFYLFLFSFTALYGQKISIESIRENRSTGSGYFDNKCEITLKVSGVELRKFKYAKLSSLSTVIDDLDNNMMPEELKTDYNDFESEPVSIKFETLIPSRQATNIKELKGEIALFAPTVANGGILKIKNIGTQTNKNLTPKMPNFKVVYITKESYEKIAADEKAKRDEEIKKQSKEMQEIAKGLSELVDAFSFMNWDSPQATFMITGDEDALISVAFETPDGNTLSSNGSSYSGSIKSYFFSEEIKPNYTLVLTIESASAVKKIPFLLKGIDLP